MWQRKQTLFLVVVGACMLLSIFFPIWIASDGGTSSALFPLHYTHTQGEEQTTIYFPYSLSAVFAIAAATLALFEIGKFENRMLQIKLGTLNSLLMASSIGCSVYFATNLIKSGQTAGEYGFALLLPAIAMMSNMVANRFIRKDEKLVRNSDRIR